VESDLILKNEIAVKNEAEYEPLITGSLYVKLEEDADPNYDDGPILEDDYDQDSEESDTKSELKELSKRIKISIKSEEEL
jgi:hypothetical protein